MLKQVIFCLANSSVDVGSCVTVYEGGAKTADFDALDVEDEPEEEGDGVMFGTWDGVFVSCILNIFGT